jgi:hypothetical protein
MRVKKLLIPACAGLAALAVSGPAGSTTNAPAIFTVKVTITDHGISMSPAHAVRGSTCTFILTNRGKKSHTFVIGDVTRGTGKGQGFQQLLRPNGQYTKVMFLDYRGVMKFFLRTRTVVTARGAFKIL